MSLRLTDCMCPPFSLMTHPHPELCCLACSTSVLQGICVPEASRPLPVSASCPTQARRSSLVRAFCQDCMVKTVSPPVSGALVQSSFLQYFSLIDGRQARYLNGWVDLGQDSHHCLHLCYAKFKNHGVGLFRILPARFDQWSKHFFSPRSSGVDQILENQAAPATIRLCSRHRRGRMAKHFVLGGLEYLQGSEHFKLLGSTNSTHSEEEHGHHMVSRSSIRSLV
jgi:hypothetical protein